MFPNIPGGPLNIIASAVTPAVMISASAILIGGVSSKHSSMSDRLRLLAAEYRQRDTSDIRRRNIEKQCGLFLRRLRLVALSHIFLYGATAFFSFMVLVIGVSTFNASWQHVLFPLFLSGVGMLLTSAVLEIVELHLGRRVLILETGDVDCQ